MNNKDNKNLLLSYSPGDFFYVKANEAGVMPTPEQCKQMNVYNNNWDISCNTKNYSDNYQQCFKKELCKNKEKVNKAGDIENKNNGANRKYLDTKDKYNDEFMNIINLGIGIILVTGFIIKNTNVSI
jgi:hypothetical protein